MTVSRPGEARRLKLRPLLTVAYNMYLQLGVDGLRGLENYDPTTEVSQDLTDIEGGANR